MNNHKMELELDCFRGYAYTKIRFQEGQITLLKGPSGAGKTTILEAICWCLYGKITRIAPIIPPKKGKTKTWVRLTLGADDEVRSIYRQTNSKVLKVTITKEDTESQFEYEDVIAQDYINDWFGNSDFWIATSYLRQKQCNPLLFGSAAEKLELITSLAFQNNDPGERISRVDSEIKIKQDKLIKTESQFTVRLGIFEDNLSQNKLTGNDIVEVPTIILDNTMMSLETASSKIKELQSELQNIESNKSHLNRLKSQYQSLNSNLRSDELTIEDVDVKLRLIDEEIEQRRQYDTYMSNQRLYTNLQQKEQTLLQRINSYQLVDDGRKVSLISQREISQIQSQTHEFERNKKLAESFSLGYTDESIDECLQELDTECEKLKNELNSLEQIRRKLQILSQLKSLELEVAKVETEADKLAKEKDEPEKITFPDRSNEIKEVERDLYNSNKKIHPLYDDEYKYIIQTLNNPPLQCPGCNCGLRYKAPVLIKVENVDVHALQNKLKEIEHQIVDTRNRNERTLIELKTEHQKYLNHQDALRNITYKLQSKENELDSYISQFNKLDAQLGDFDPSTTLDERRIDEIKVQQKSLLQRITRIESIKVILPPNRTVDDIIQDNRLYEFRELQKELIPLRDNLSQLSQIVSDASGGCVGMSKFIYTSVNQAKSEYNRLLQVKVTINQIASLLIQISEFENMIKNVDYDDKRETISNLTSQVNRYHTVLKLQQERDHLVPIREELLSLQKGVSTLGRLKQVMIDAEYTSYERVSGILNIHLEDIIQSLFIEPIAVKLSMFKTLKTKDRIKPSVNLVVFFDGMEIEPRDLSWGQKERLSLALTIALTKLNSSPLVLMDEPLATLSETDKERAVKTMVDYGKEPNKIFLCVAHVSVTGWYDQVVKFDRCSPQNLT